ncbi:MAG TPA: YggS family pyridoxal phosphate-dependent enzyme [Actinomycetota bacterium]|nr:YggS family pyridoxal phosphate-dependent enzyme [Actinomycetota bacterium]
MSAHAEEIASNLDTVRRRLADAAVDASRDPAAVRLIVVTKTVSVATIRDAIAAGARDLGENYVNELREKRPAIEDPEVRWHFIGALQSSTAQHVADLADVVHTVAGERAARRLAGRAARDGRTLDALLEVDFTTERAGLSPEAVPGAAELLASLEGVHLRGLMTIAPLTPDAEGARPWFRRLRELRDTLRERHPDVLDLSMGMSLDYQVAVQEGATMVRIGTAVFGARTPPPGR